MRSPFSRKSSAPVEPEAPVMRKKRSTADMIAENKGPGFVVTTFRTLAGLAVAAAIGVGVFFAAAAIEGDAPSPLAPWNDAAAPQVTPDPLVDQ